MLLKFDTWHKKKTKNDIIIIIILGPGVDKQLHSMHSEHSLMNMCTWSGMVAIIGKSYAHLVTHIFVSKSHLYDIKSNSYI